MNLYKTLIGQNVQFILISFMQKVLYLLFAFSTIGIAAQFFTTTKIDIEEKKTLDSFEDIVKSKIPINAKTNYDVALYLKKLEEIKKLNPKIDNGMLIKRMSAADC